MGEILGIGMSHVPYMMNAPENMLRLRQVLMKVVERIEKRKSNLRKPQFELRQDGVAEGFGGDACTVRNEEDGTVGRRKKRVRHKYCLNVNHENF